jgi:DNA ligase-4
VTAQTLHTIAREAVGRDRSHKDVDDALRLMWGKPCSPHVNSTPKKREREEMWRERLENVDTSSPTKRFKTQTTDGADPPNRPNSERNKSAKARTPAPLSTLSVTGGENVATSATSITPRRPSLGLGLRALGSMTNLTKLTTSVSRQSGVPGQPILVTLPAVTRATRKDVDQDIINDASDIGLHSELASARISLPISRSFTPAVECDSSKPRGAVFKTRLPTYEFSELASHDQNRRCIGLENSVYVSSTLFRFLRDSLIYVARDGDLHRPAWRPSLHTVLPHSKRVHGLEAFLRGCGWHSDETGPHIPGVQRGIVLIEEGHEDCRDRTLTTIATRGKELEFGGHARERRLSIVVVDTRVFERTRLTADVIEFNAQKEVQWTFQIVDYE